MARFLGGSGIGDLDQLRLDYVGVRFASRLRVRVELGTIHDALVCVNQRHPSRVSWPGSDSGSRRLGITGLGSVGLVTSSKHVVRRMLAERRSERYDRKHVGDSHDCDTAQLVNSSKEGLERI
jgi:hypothetical protein